MNRGILLVAIGKDYERLAACACRYGRKYTDLPFCVVTDVTKANECNAWKDVGGVQFIRGDYKQKSNRLQKLRMPYYTPFEETLYIDSDAVIQRSGVEQAFDTLDGADIGFNKLTRFRADKIPNIYIRAMRMFQCRPPLDVYSGGIIVFRKSDIVKDFFSKWLGFWEQFGKGREMPPLNCVIQKTGIPIGVMPGGFFEPDGYNKDAVIQHNYGKDFVKRYNLSHWQPYKPFDNAGSVTDFRWGAWK